MVQCKNCKIELPMHRLGCPEAKGETALYAKIEQLQAELAEAIEALQELYDWQNGVPLVRYEKQYNNALAMTVAVLWKFNQRTK